MLTEKIVEFKNNDAYMMNIAKFEAKLINRIQTLKLFKFNKSELVLLDK